jgi:uncharacterized protein YbaP (TraB family)
MSQAVSKLSKNIISTLAAGLLWLAFSAVNAGSLPVWQLEGTDNHILLMGSVHFLRADDYPLPAGMEAAYLAADKLVMEIDMDSLDQLTIQASMTAMAVNADGASLRDVIGASSYAEAANLAQGLGVPLALFDPFKPWFAALSITQLRMLELGFDPAWGIETHLTNRAQTDNKEIFGLESLEEQLGFMDRLDNETQKIFLLQSLEDATEVEQEVTGIVAAWRDGDTKILEEYLLDGLEEAPKLYDSILVQRNRNWVPQIVELTESTDDYLIIVGAMHLIGENSVLNMLAERGIKSRQLTDEDFE